MDKRGNKTCKINMKKENIIERDTFSGKIKKFMDFQEVEKKTTKKSWSREGKRQQLVEK